MGDVTPLRKILGQSKLSKITKQFIEDLNDEDFREQFLKRIHFDCGAIGFRFLQQQLQAKLIKALQERGGVASQASDCLNNVLVHLLKKSIQKEDRFVDRASLESLLEAATHIPMSRAQLDAQNELIARVLSASIPKSNDLISARLAQPRPIGDVPLPAAIAQRTVYIGNIVTSLDVHGVGWILGAAGVGKTVAAKLAALHAGGNWASVNLRGLSAEQASDLISEMSTLILEGQNVRGLLVDDLEFAFEPYVLDKFLNLLSVCKRRDLLLLVTAPRPAPSDMLFAANLPPAVETRLDDFTEGDIQEILNSLGVSDPNWAKYIHLVSGGGHPQLAIATVQSMQRAGWDAGEFRTLNSLLIGNSEVNQVRARTRERLLKELPEGSRRLLERLSLTSRGFKRSLVLDLAQVNPRVADGGILFEQLIGSWIDQQEKDRFSLSPLLSNFASTTLTDAQREQMNFEIANSLIKPRTLDPIEANSALIAAWSGKNEDVILKICLSIIGSDASDLKMIAPHFLILTHMRTDKLAYEKNPVVSQMFRGAQLILLCYGETESGYFQSVVEAFDTETERVRDGAVRASMALIIYSKLLLSEPGFGALPHFAAMSQKLDALFENDNGDLPEDLMKEINRETGLSRAISFMFLNQTRQLKLISDLVSVFDFLNTSSDNFRANIFAAYDAPELSLDADMLISGAWLREHDADTIDPPVHSSAYAYMEGLAEDWARKDLAIACRKYRAIILDEYGDDKEAALRVLDEGLQKYGATSSELIRAKAKILYRANEHQASLELSSRLIDGGAPLSETEKAFLGREAAISAEKQGDFETARRYYLFGAAAAEESGVSDMMPMHIGLLADAALASWHSGNREKCLVDLINVLKKLEKLDPKSSLRAAHCHAVSRHLLLWLDQDASGEPRYMIGGEVPRIYAGLVSNPEPHSEIGDRFLPPLEISWYMLAQIECHCLLDVGITRNIDLHLGKGPVREGQMLLNRAKLDKAFRLKDVELFRHSLAEMVTQFAFVTKQGSPEKSFNIENVTFGLFPMPTMEEKNALIGPTEGQLLSFASACLLAKNTPAFDTLLRELEKPEGFARRAEMMACLSGASSGTDYNSGFASLLALNRQEIDGVAVLSPRQSFELALKSLQIAKLSGQVPYISQCTLTWLKERWEFVWARQRFLLRQPALHESSISNAWAQDDVGIYARVLAVLIAILPTIGVSNEHNIEQLLRDMLDSPP